MKKKFSKELDKAKKDYEDVGGWRGMKSGEWLIKIITKSFKNYFEKADEEYFKLKYGTDDKKYIAKKLIKVAAKNASLLGGITGATVSVDEAAALLTGGEAGVGLPANIAIAGLSIGVEAIVLINIQLKLVANLAKLYDDPLDPDDPEDILIILAYALGGKLTDTLSKFLAKKSGILAKNTIKRVIKKEVLAELKRLGAKMGMKILQRNIIKYTVPGVSIMVGGGWNYFATKKVGKIAIKYFKERAQEHATSRKGDK